jgi:hypothetical protein
MTLLEENITQYCPSTSKYIPRGKKTAKNVRFVRTGNVGVPVHGISVRQNGKRTTDAELHRGQAESGIHSFFKNGSMLQRRHPKCRILKC